MIPLNSDMTIPGAATDSSAEEIHNNRTSLYSRHPSSPLFASFQPLYLRSNARNPNIIVAPQASASRVDGLQDEDAGGVSLISSGRNSDVDAVIRSEHGVFLAESNCHSSEAPFTPLENTEGGVELPRSGSQADADDAHPIDLNTSVTLDSSSRVQARQSSMHSRRELRRSRPSIHQSDDHSSPLDLGVHDELTTAFDDMIDMQSTFAEANRPGAASDNTNGSMSPETAGTHTDPLASLVHDANVEGFLPPGASEAMLAYYQRGAGIDSNPLDDTRLDYDVADFLDRWHMQIAMPEAGLIELDANRIRGWRPPLEESTTDLPDPARDIQGLNWTYLGTRRDLARTARTMLYPSYDYFRTSRSSKSMISTERRNLFDFKQTHSSHRARFTHFQLRHVLAATSRNDVFYAAYNKVIRTSLACPAIADPIIDLSSLSGSLSRATADCHITTIAVSPPSDFAGYASHSMLIAGGFEGEYAMLNLNSDSGAAPTEGFVTHAIDGITTHIHTLPNRRTGALSAAFCSNDRKLRLLDMTTNTWTNSFEYEDQLNCAATSPDGRLRVVVGDTNHSLITDAEKGDVLFSMHEHADHAFACTWADDGWHVATGAQDGKVVVYDARYWKEPVARLDREMGCVRSLHFTQTGHGSLALVVAESDDIVSVYDSQAWRSKQTIDFFGSVAGVTTLDGGRELVIANGDKLVGGLMVFERNDTGVGAPMYRDSEDLSQDRSNSAGKSRRGSRKRTTDNDDADDFWENQPKRFGVDLESLVI